MEAQRNSMFKIHRAFFCGFLLILFGSGFVFSQNRYALVIGNNNYQDSGISNLTNPVNDATDVAEALRELGYSVTLRTNAGLRDMLGAVRDFTASLMSCLWTKL